MWGRLDVCFAAAAATAAAAVGTAVAVAAHKNLKLMTHFTWRFFASGPLSVQC